MHNWNTGTGTAYVTAGIGYGKTPLAAFDAAEVNAKIHATNAIRVTSFVPPQWDIVLHAADLEDRSSRGAFLPMAYQFACSATERVAASLVIGKNADTSQASIIMEHAEIGLVPEALHRIAKESIDEVYENRGWSIREYVDVSIGAEPAQGLFAGVLVAVLFFPET